MLNIKIIEVLLLVKCYDNKMVRSLVDLTILSFVGARGGKATKKIAAATMHRKEPSFVIRQSVVLANAILSSERTVLNSDLIYTN